MRLINFAILCLAISMVVKCNDFELLAQMSNLDFGKTIIATLQIELSSGNNSADHVLDLLKQMKESTTSEMDDSKQISESRKGQCESRLGDIDSVFNAARVKKVEDEQTVPLKQEQLNDKLQQLKDKQSQEQRNKDRISALDSGRLEDGKLFASKRDESLELLEALAQAKKIISQLASKSQFLQSADDVKAKLKKHHDSLKDKLGNQSGYLSLIQMLLEAAKDSNVSKDSKLVGSVVSIIDELVQSIHNLMAVEAQADEAKNQIYLSQKARFEVENGQLEGTLARLFAESESLKQVMLELTNDINSKSKVVDAKAQERKDWVKTCDDQLRIHEKTLVQKNEELSIITQCIEIFSSRFTDAICSYIQKMHIKN